jgi:hypothetical protein
MASLSNRVRSNLDTSGSLVPVGTIVAYMPGYFAATANGGGWTAAGPAGNTVAQINAFLSGNWRVCNGTAPNDANSPIFNAAGRFLPDLTGSRFLMGNTTAGTAGGNANNQVTLTTTELPSHNHGASITVNAAAAPHSHSVSTNAAPAGGGESVDHSHSVSPFSTGSQSANHNHTVPVGRVSTDFPNGATGLAIVGSNPGASVIGTSAPIGSNQQSHSHDVVSHGTNGRSVGHTHSTPSLSGTAADSPGIAPHSHPGSASTTPAGSGSAFSILPLYVATYYIMRIK